MTNQRVRYGRNVDAPTQNKYSCVDVKIVGTPEADCRKTMAPPRVLLLLLLLLFLPLLLLLRLWKRCRACGFSDYCLPRKFLSRTQDAPFFFTRAITSLPRKVTPAILFPSSVSLLLPDNSTKVSRDRRGPRDIAILQLHGARDRPIRVTIIVVRFEAKLAHSVSLSIQLEPLRIFSVSLFFYRNVLTKDSFTKVVTSFSKMSCSTASVLTIT